MATFGMLDEIRHGQIQLWPRAGVGPEERDWLEMHHPGLNDTYGRIWDVVGANTVDGKMDLTGPATLPIVCNMCQIPITGTPHGAWSTSAGPRDYVLDHKGRRYHFCSDECRWIFNTDPGRYEGHLSLVDRFLSGMIQPMDLFGALNYMNLAPGEMGDDAEGYAWGAAYKDHPRIGNIAPQFAQPAHKQRRNVAFGAGCAN
jgi:toluene monooxygenase system protein A